MLFCCFFFFCFLVWMVYVYVYIHIIYLFLFMYYLICLCIYCFIFSFVFIVLCLALYLLFYIWLCIYCFISIFWFKSFRWNSLKYFFNRIPLLLSFTLISLMWSIIHFLLVLPQYQCVGLPLWLHLQSLLPLNTCVTYAFHSIIYRSFIIMRFNVLFLCIFSAYSLLPVHHYYRLVYFNK